jgi:hypothetical protein
MGVVRQEAGRWSTCAAGATVAGNPSWMDLARFFASAQYDAALRALEYAVRTGGSAFEHALEASLTEALARPEFCESFAAAHAALTHLLYSGVADAYKISPSARVVEATPALCQALLAIDDCTAIAGGDVYVLLGALPYLNDQRAAQLLQSLRAGITPDGVFLLGEVIEHGAESGELALLIDLHLLLISPLARLRTLPELRALLCAANFRLEQSIALPSGASLLVARPVPSFTTSLAKRRTIPCAH